MTVKHVLLRQCSQDSMHHFDAKMTRKRRESNKKERVPFKFFQLCQTIFGKIHFLLISENPFFCEIKRDGITSFHGIHEFREWLFECEDSSRQNFLADEFLRKTDHN